MAIRRTLELHGSTLLRLTREGEDVHVELDAYIHRENDALDVDAGRWTGWRQRVSLVLRNAVVEGEPARLPTGIAEGELLIVAPRRERRFSVLPVPYHSQADAEELSLWLEGPGGELLVRAKAATLNEEEEARFVERNAFGM